MIFLFSMIHILFGQRQHGTCTYCLSSHYYSVKREHRSTPHLKSALQPQNHVKFLNVTEFNSVKCVIILQRTQGMVSETTVYNTIFLCDLTTIC